jgi:hypothetical protein
MSRPYSIADIWFAGGSDSTTGLLNNQFHSGLRRNETSGLKLQGFGFRNFRVRRSTTYGCRAMSTMLAS